MVEKLNVTGLNLSQYDKHQLAQICNKALQEGYKKEFTMEFSRDRKSMSVYCLPEGRALRYQDSNAKLFVKGAPESILDRCTSVRVGKETVPLSSKMKSAILDQILLYGTGQVTLKLIKSYVKTFGREIWGKLVSGKLNGSLKTLQVAFFTKH